MRASIWYTICNVLQKGMALLATPIFTRIMSAEEYGVYTIYQSWYSIIMILGTMNLFYSGYMTGLSKFKNERYTLTSSMQGMCTFLSAILLGIYICSYNMWNSILGLPMSIVVAIFIQLFCEPGYSFWTTMCRYQYKYKISVIVTLLTAVLSNLLGIIFVLNNTHKAEARIFSYVLIQSGVGLVCYIYNFVNGKKLFCRKYWIFGLRFNIPLVPHYLSFIILNQSDRIMISNMIGNAQAAIYSVAYTIAMMLQIITNALSNAFTPYTYRCLESGDFERHKKLYNIMFAFIAILCFIIILFAPEVVKVFAATEYYEAIWVMPPVTTAAFFLFLYPVFSAVEFFFERTKFIMAASSMGAVTNILLNIICIKHFGYIAAGYTTLVCYIAFAIAHYVFYKRILKKNAIEDIYDIRFIVLMSLIVIVGMFVGILTYKNIILRYSIISLCFATIFLKRKVIISKLTLLKRWQKE